MCPICLATTAAIVATSATSTGGIAAIVLKVARGKRSTKAADPPASSRNGA
jgi:hypothetical protein